MQSKKKTSWSYDDLKNLTNIDNHRAVYDGYSYVWEHKLKGVWSKHYIILLDDINKFKALLMFSLYNWKKELSNRDKDILRADRQKIKIASISRNKQYKTIIKIARKKIKPIKKVEMILEVSSDIPNDLIYKAIGISKASFYRYIKEINDKKTTL